MKTEYKIQERETGFHLEVTLANGMMYRITAMDQYNFITVQSLDGSMIILPSVSNEIKISSK